MNAPYLAWSRVFALSSAVAACATVVRLVYLADNICGCEDEDVKFGRVWGGGFADGRQTFI